LRASVRAFLARPAHLLIDGQWQEAASGETFDVLDPATGQRIASVAKGTAVDIDRAVAAARRAFTRGPWSRMLSAERGRLLNRLADLIESRLDEIAELESLDGGNPLSSLRRADLPMALANLRATAGWADKITGETYLSRPAGHGLTYVLRQPIGVAGLITPWNAPFLMALNKIGTALAAGCTCVLKPAELAPLSALWLGTLIQELDFPAGTVNIVPGLGPEAGAALAEHPDVNKISFTGSTAVGRSIMIAAAGTMKRVTLELGGKSPVLVFPDADLEAAAAAITAEITFKTGQFCAAGTRLFVHHDVETRLLDALSTLSRKITLGHGLQASTQMGPLISRRQLDRVLHYIDEGKRSGAQLVTGGKAVPGSGFFVEPTLLADARPDTSVMTDEIFGPVLCAAPFVEDDLDAIASLANHTPYGLAAKIWTRDLRTTHQLARKLDAGLITVNGGGGEGARPFGGFKQSGIGREGGREGVLAYTELKSVSIGY